MGKSAARGLNTQSAVASFRGGGGKGNAETLSEFRKGG